MLIFPDLASCAALCADPGSAAPAEILRHEIVQRRFESLLDDFAKESTGSSNRVTRAILAEEPPSLDAGEVTDKGSLNQRAVLNRRAALVEQLYQDEPGIRTLRIRGK
jgi:feruloyl-CoA synthase